METGKNIKQALSSGNVTLLRELARSSPTQQQGMALEFIAELIEDRSGENHSSAA